MKRILAILLLTIGGYPAISQTASLPRSTPESEGVSARALLSFLDAAAMNNHEFHSLMVVRHGKVLAEGWWNPYRPELKHSLYSVSKSFTATAVGFAVSEGKLSVEDNVLSFFPDLVPASVSPNLAALKVKHLLTMSVGQKSDPSGDVSRSANWAKTFLNTPIVYEPGSKFLYNSAATYMLSAIVQKVTGQKIIDYLGSRLFAPLGIQGMDWETSPDGINAGGWGLRLKTEDLAKFGQLFLQKGKWKGKQIIPAAWVEQASTMKIMQDPDAPQAKIDSSDWLQGYCYQMWRSRHHSFRADGAFGQYILVLPDLDAVVAITSETTSMQSELNLIWKYLLPAFSSAKLAADPASDKLLKEKLASLALPLGPTASSGAGPAIADKTFFNASPDRRLKSYQLHFDAGICTLTLNTDSARYDYQFGSGKWITSETTRLGPYLVERARNNRVGLPPFAIAGTYGWAGPKNLEMVLRYVESAHSETIRCTVDSAAVSLTFVNSFNKSSNAAVFKGVQKGERKSSPRLIVRGDDMGFAHSADQALINCYKQGIETSIEVIAPSPWFPETARLLQNTKGVDVGLHFAITSEWDNIKWRPLTDCPSLRNPDGYFYPMLNPNKNYPKMSVMENAWKLDDIEKELRAQIHLVLKYVPRISHISGHMGSTSFNPEVKAMVDRVSKEFHIPDWDAGPYKPATVSYIGIDGAGKTTDERIQRFIDMLDKLEDGKTYIFVEHPGLDGDELRAIYHIGYEDVAKARQDVTTLFTSERVKEAILRKGITLVSYKDVINSSN